MKKKIITLAAIGCIACLSFVLVSCSSGGEAKNDSAGDNQTTEARTALAIGFDQDFPPYGFIGDDGQPTGFDLDLAAEVCNRRGWEVKFVPINWDSKDLELSSGAIDCIWNGFTIEGRENDYTFTDPYMDNSQVIVVREDSGITDLAGLADKNVMVQKASAAFNLLSEEGDQAALAQTFKDLKSIDEYNSAFMELESGAVDAVALDLPVANFQIAGKEDQFVILKDSLSVEHYGVGFLLGDTELKDEVQATLQEMTTDGTVEQICDKYKDKGISFDRWCLPAA